MKTTQAKPGDPKWVRHLTAAAAAAHEVNRAWCVAHGDNSQPHWADAPAWQRESAIEGVLGVLRGNTPEQSHACWLEHKQREGWVYGPVKDPERKVHPCMVPYAELPPEQQAKDHNFVAVVRAVLAELRVEAKRRVVR